MRVLGARILTTVCCLTFYSGFSSSQTLSGNAIDNIDAIMKASLREYSIPGAVAVVTNGERIIYVSAFGFADVLNQKPMSTDSIFRIASMTKPITSTGLMLLVEGGEVKLEDSISNHLSELPPFEIFDEFDFDDASFTTNLAEKEVTIKHLLTHTSGMAYNFNSFELAASGAPLFNRNRYLLQHEPGERWTYGPSTNLLGDVIVTKSNAGLFEFFEKELFLPLGMDETVFEVPATEAERVVTIHQKTGNTFVEAQNPEIISSPELGHGGLNSTASDYSKFMRLFLNNGLSDSGERLLKAETIDEMASNQIGNLKAELQPEARPQLAKAFPQFPGVDNWGLGFQLAGADGEFQRNKGSMSWAGIFNTKFWIDRKANIAAAIFMQYLPFDDEHHLDVLTKFEAAVYKNLNQ